MKLSGRKNRKGKKHEIKIRRLSPFFYYICGVTYLLIRPKLGRGMPDPAHNQ